MQNKKIENNDDGWGRTGAADVDYKMAGRQKSELGNWTENEARQQNLI